MGRSPPIEHSSNIAIYTGSSKRKMTKALKSATWNGTDKRNKCCTIRGCEWYIAYVLNITYPING